MMKQVILLLIFIFSTRLEAQSVAVLDTGVDLEHPDLQGLILRNSAEISDGQDSDQNGYVDDLYGWNFCANTPIVFDDERRSPPNSDIYKYYWVRTRRSFGTWSVAEESWYLNQRRDEVFMAERAQYSSYNHGTHVAAIAARGALATPALDSDLPIPARYQVKGQNSFPVLAIKYLGDDTYAPWRAPRMRTLDPELTLAQKKLDLNRFLKRYQEWQLAKLERAIRYAVSHTSVKVINGSFGKSYESSLIQVNSWLKRAGLPLDAAPELTSRFLSELNQQFSLLAQQHPQVLFTFSAGNAAENTDERLHFPSGARTAPNVISVGASLAYEERAYFSNYGPKSVDLFAPGVAILSSATPNERVPINGTSQAAPIVAHLALQLAHHALELSGSELKRLITESVDVHPELKDFAASGGIINPQRARRALEHFKRGLSITDALALARAEILTRTKTLPTLYRPNELTAGPLPSPF